ncbi:enoyl-CoA hydratase-related protein [Streptomyces sp. NPDC056716]|uniref:enoyl-CoA hydratase-related protein n=1 Tax=unclassified Streptomyces TaxID=2593676 RepID=UPI0036978F40
MSAVVNDAVQVSREGAIATVRLNRPARMNSMTSGLLDGLLTALEDIAADREVRVVLLTGNGKAFCAGGDLSAGLDEINGAPPLTSQHRRLRTFVRASQLLYTMPQVTIAAINGACAGAGLSLALACDLRYAADSARFSTAFLGAGVSGDFGGIWFATRTLGAQLTRSLFLLSERFDAADAQRVGLVTGIHPGAELLPEVRSVAEGLASRAPLALSAMKQNLIDAESMDIATYLEVESGRQAFTVATADAAEAAASFIERRTPRFEGK